MDGSGRITALKTQSLSNFTGGGVEQDAVAGQDSTTNYNYAYNGMGQITSIQATGMNDSSGTSTIKYNANGEEVAISQGQGDGMAGNESSAYAYNTVGQIIAQEHIDGQAGDATERINYDYDSVTNSQVGEAGQYADGQYHTYLDGGSYERVQQTTPDSIGNGQSGYTATGGESLAQVAQNMYGNSALWYLIANANGLTENSTLKAGEQINIPSGAATGQSKSSITKPYNASTIEGSNLPNLQTPPPGGHCGGFAKLLATIVEIAVTIAVNAILPGGGILLNALDAGIATAVGDFAKQTVLIAFDVQHGYNKDELETSFKNGAKGSLNKNIAAAIANEIIPDSGDIGSAIGNAIVQNVVTQGMQMAEHIQQRFDFGGVAAAGLTGGFGASDFGKQAASSFNNFINSGVDDVANSVGDYSSNEMDQLNGKVDRFVDGTISMVVTQGLSNAFARNSSQRHTLTTAEVLGAQVGDWLGESASDAIQNAKINATRGGPV